jgi:hypothetical protein
MEMDELGGQPNTMVLICDNVMCGCFVGRQLRFESKVGTKRRRITKTTARFLIG